MIDWNMILGLDSHSEALTGMYGTRSVIELSEHLGVSVTALSRKFKIEKVPMRRGKYNRFRSIDNKTFESFTPKEISKQFGVDLSSVYKHIHQRGLTVKRKGSCA